MHVDLAQPPAKQRNFEELVLAHAMGTKFDHEREREDIQIAVVVEHNKKRALPREVLPPNSLTRKKDLEEIVSNEE